MGRKKKKKMKKKVVKLSESDLENLVQKIIKEDELNNIKEALPKRELERHQSNWRRGDFEPYKREDELMKAFGPYSKDIPPHVISYLRKNPRIFLKRIVDVYGMDRVLDFIGYKN
jgi:hypothetical protein